MRVISQDGMIDIPYENFVFGVTKDNSIVVIRDTVARPAEIAHGVVAKYSTETKAKKAMEMLHQKYNDIHFMSITGNSNELKIAASLLTKSSFNEVTNPYFQFPSDEEMEA